MSKQLGFKGIAKTKAAPAKKYVAKAIDIGASDAEIATGTYLDANFGRLAQAELYWYCYMQHPWIRACVDLNSNAVSQEGFAIAPVDGSNPKPLDDEDDERVPLINTWFQNGFVGMSSRSALVAMNCDLEIFAASYWLKKRDTQGDKMIYLERLNPRLVEPVLSEDGTEIASYMLKKPVSQTPSGTITSVQDAKKLNAKDVIRFKRTGGGDPVLGSPSLLESLDLTAAIDFAIREHRKSFFKNGMVPGTIISSADADEDATSALIKSLKAKTGAKNAYKTTVAMGDWKVQALAQTGKNDVDFEKGTGISRDEICAVFTVPPGKLLFSNNSLGASGKAEDDETFQQECVLPREEMIYEQITEYILKQEFGIDDLKLIPQRRAQLKFERIDAAMKLVQCGGTGNEARELVGLEPIDDPEMDLPRFDKHTGMTADGDVPTPQGGKTPAQPQQNGNGEGNIKPNEVAPKGQKGKSRSLGAWY